MVTTSECVSSEGCAPIGGMKLHTRYATGSDAVFAQLLAADAFVHPRAAALLGARVQIDEEAAAP